MTTMDPNQDHEILVEVASEMTARYRESEWFNGIKGGFFGKSAIQDILKQDECVGIRYYYGLDPDEVPVLILVGVTADNRDMVEGKLAELSTTCPPTCDSESALCGE